MSDNLPDPDELPRPFGRYVLTEHLAAGGMAEIFRARQDGPGDFARELVIKRIRPELAGNRSFLEMFLDEARLAAMLQHPNIVQIHEVGEVDRCYFMAMELVVGPNLGGVVRACADTDRPMPPGVAARICAGVAEGLHYAHHLKGLDGQPLGIVHRDISTSNILVSYEGVPRIVDFGIAKAENKTHETTTGVVKGKIAYMPPEQIRKESVDCRTDLYALGVVLYRLLTLHMPYTGSNDLELMNAICTGGYVPVTVLRADVPLVTDTIIERALALRPENRFADGKEMCRALEELAAANTPTSYFGVSEFLAELRECSSTPLDELGIPGSSKNVAAPTVSVGNTAPTVEIHKTTTPALNPAETSRARRRGWIAWAVGAAAVLAVAVTLWLGRGESSQTTAAPPPPPPTTEVSEVAVEPKAEPVTPTAAPVVPEKKNKAKKRRRKRKSVEAVATTPEPKPVVEPPPVDVTPGRVSFVVKPWGHVYIDGNKRGVTPMPPLQISPGTHVIRVVHPDTGKEQERRIEVHPGGSHVVRIDLTR